MAHVPRSAQPAETAWNELDRALEEIDRLAQQEVEPETFYAPALAKVVSAIAAEGAAVWTWSRPGEFALEHAVAPTGVSFEPSAIAGLLPILMRAVEKGSHAIPPRSSRGDASETLNPTDYLFLAASWTDAAGGGVLVVYHRPGLSPAAERGCLEFLEAIGELFAGFRRNLQLADLRQSTARWQQFQQFAEQVHASLELDRTAFTIVNEARRLIGCDRVSVLVRRGRKCRAVAVSGVDQVNRRSNQVRKLERLAAAVVRGDERLDWLGGAWDLAPQIDERLHDYVDEAHCRAVVVLPLSPPPKIQDGEENREPPVAALTVEWFYGAVGREARQAISAIERPAATALGHALDLRRVPLFGLLRWLGRSRWLFQLRQLPWTVSIAAALIAAVAALCLLPADFTIEARGELQPVRTREVFAPADGVVQELHAVHGQLAPQGTVLARIRRSELDFEFKRVVGELQTARKQLASVEAERLQNRRETAEDQQRYGQATAQHEELREKIAGLEAQQAVLERQQAELTVTSPMTGSVLTWNAEQNLLARPVTRGQILLSLGDLSGPWRLELRVPDHRVAHVLAAREEMGQSLEVEYALATDPAPRYWGTLGPTGMRTEIGETDGAFVLAGVRIESDELPERVPGAGVVARIHCGRRSLGYVWFHDLIDAVRTWIWF